jgi:hypothetical protein
MAISLTTFQMAKAKGQSSLSLLGLGIGDWGPVVSRLAGSFVSSFVDGYMDGGYLGLGAAGCLPSVDGQRLIADYCPSRPLPLTVTIEPRRQVAAAFQAADCEFKSH